MVIGEAAPNSVAAGDFHYPFVGLNRLFSAPPTITSPITSAEPSDSSDRNSRDASANASRPPPITTALSARTIAIEADPDTAEFALRVQAALDELPPEQRSVAHLKLWQGLTFEEIAVAQGIPLHTAASRYRYGLAKLRAQKHTLV